jgi:CBS domain-containing protein
MATDEVVVDVGSLMSRPLIAVDAAERVTEAAQVMSERNISSVLVKAKGEYVGLLTDRDIIRNIVAKEPHHDQCCRVHRRRGRPDAHTQDQEVDRGSESSTHRDDL